ncbi:hypothetical protein GIB67_008904 [Kingdonia uniflora]|uniref:Uncharacterized protein n=1 Tax=Kingdonia uniflora TaxID=39325 RepID=A0A7J7LVN1_9MAGN|nr:hypothetical protein GIB67_008904 [Kingdonia uniflora]
MTDSTQNNAAVEATEEYPKMMENWGLPSYHELGTLETLPHFQAFFVAAVMTKRTFAKIYIARQRMIVIDVERTRRVTYGKGRCSKHRDLSNRVYTSPQARASAIEKAEALESTLEEEFPSFIKPMLQSHTTGGFRLVSQSPL